MKTRQQPHDRGAPWQPGDEPVKIPRNPARTSPPGSVRHGRTLEAHNYQEPGAVLRPWARSPAEQPRGFLSRDGERVLRFGGLESQRTRGVARDKEAHRTAPVWQGNTLKSHLASGKRVDKRT